MADEFDDILGTESNIKSVQTVDQLVEGVKETDEIFLRGNDCPVEYVSMVNRIKRQYDLLPKIDFDKVYKELSDLTVKSCPTPSLQVLNDEIQKVQAAKDRLSEIFVNVLKCYNFKKRAVDILVDSWGKFTSEKNAEGRKGDASFRLSNFSLDLALIEGLLKSCTHILRNLDSLHDTLSRRITIIQLTMKLGDIGRTALPDFDFDRSSTRQADNVLITEEKGGVNLENF